MERSLSGNDDPSKSPGSWRKPIGSPNSFRRPPIASMSYDQLAQLAHLEAPLDPEPESSGTDSEIDDIPPFEPTLPEFETRLQAGEDGPCLECAETFNSESLLAGYCEDCVCVGLKQLDHEPHVIRNGRTRVETGSLGL